MSAEFDHAVVTADLERGVAALETATEPPIPAMVAYLRLLHRWNRAYNLSAVREPRAMVVRHVLDSLTTLPYIEGPRLLDVGSGAGLPGIVIALCRPELQVVLLDSNGKKTRFLRQVALELELPAVEVVHARVEAYRPPLESETIISRAFARLDTFVQQAGRLCAPHGRMLAMKGAFDAATETVELPPGWRYTVHPLVVPGLEAERNMVLVEPEGTDRTESQHG